MRPRLPGLSRADRPEAGEVVELGEGVTGFEVGERVIPMPGYPLKKAEYDVRPAGIASSFTLPGLGRLGVYSQCAEFPARWVVKDTTGLKPEEVAVLPMVLATGVRSVKEVECARNQRKGGDR